MKLPEIDEAPVQESSPSIAQMGEAEQKTFQTFQHGLHAFSQEMVKTQHNKAAADLLSGLDSSIINLREKKTISTQELRDELGSDFDRLPPEIKQQTSKYVLNRDTWSGEYQDRDDIPMFAVAGHIFDSRAKKLLADSTGTFTSKEWADKFKGAAGSEIVRKKMELSQHTMKDMHDYFQEEDTKSALDLANAGQYEMARQVVKGSRTMDLKHATDLNTLITKTEQTRPLYEAIRTGNIGEMAKMLPSLGDTEQFTKLSPEERQTFTHRLQSEIKGFQDGIKRAEDEQLRRNSEAGWNGIFEKSRQGAAVSYADIPMPGLIKAEQQKEMIAYVDKLNKGERPETDWTLYSGLTDLAAKDRKKFSTIDLLTYRNKLSDGDFKHFIDLQMNLKGGNPDAYDHFQTTDEAINTQLAGPLYAINAKDKADKIQEKVGYIKTLVQHELANAQENNNGKPLSLEERDGIIRETLKANIDARHDKWNGLATAGAVLPAHEAGVDAATAVTFQKAVTQLDPGIMHGTDSDKKIDTMKERYKDYTKYEPLISSAWRVQRGKNISADDSVRVWYWVNANRARLEGVLRKEGSFEEGRGTEGANDSKITQLAVQEVLRKIGR